MRPWLAFLAVFTASPAWAHAMLEEARPAAGAVLAKPPREIVLRFSEALEGAFSSVAVRGPGGAVAAAATAHTGDRTMRVVVKPLGPGSYRVIWRVVSVDTHETEGSYTFTVKP